MGFLEDWTDLLDLAEKVTLGIFKGIKENCQEEMALYSATLPVYKTHFPRLKLQEAQEVIFKETGRDVRGDPDLSPEDEKDICEWAKKKHGSEMVFITHFPTSKRPFYVHPDPDDSELTLSFDLLGRGLEWVTGGQRIHEYDKLVSNIKKWGNDPKDFELYLQAFKYGMPPHGGRDATSRGICDRRGAGDDADFGTSKYSGSQPLPPRYETSGSPPLTLFF